MSTIVTPSPDPLPQRSAGATTAFPAEYATFSRVHWGAIIAGALIAVAVAFSLNLLGVGIGLSTVDPVTESHPFAGLGTGAIIWYVVSTLIALFTGGYVAGRLAGFPKETTAGLHGVLTWALFTLFSLYLLNSAVGRVFNIVGSTISGVASAAGNAVGAAVPDDLGQTIQQELRQSDISLEDIRNEAFQLLEDTGKPALDPDNLEQDAQAAGNTLERTAGDAASSPYGAGREINDAISQIRQRGGKVIDAADKDALVNILVARTDQSEAEARRTVDAWAQKYQEAVATVDQKMEQLGDKAAEVGDDVADTLATVSILGFLALLAGAGAAFFGGALGRPRDLTLSGDGNTINAATVS